MRRYSIDWLRIFGIFLLFPFHTARIFDYWEPNYVKDTPNWFSSWFVAGTSIWFMPLLFLIAGFSSYHALLKRTPREYVRERVFRLLIPFLLGIVLIVPIQGYLARVQQFGYTGNYFAFLAAYFTDFSDITGYTGAFTPGHLWFLLYLFIISMSLLPVMRKIGKGMDPKWSVLLKPQIFLLAFLPLTVAEALPGISGKNPFYYAIFFIIGYVVAATPGFLDAIKKFRLPALIAAIVTVPVYFMLMVRLGWPSGYTVLAGAMALFRNIAVWLALLALLGFADAHFYKPSAALDYLNRASFPVYVLHQSVMMVVAFFVVAWDIPVGMKFVVIMLCSLAASLMGYEVFRRFGATRFILGIK